ncbi:hypothetical protein [uncultured Alistipes sp.]|uniref:hypothetical protein n=1 Tax=uncultured Alistipes sp. TaxID=538949 RepID=UPI0026470D52|nr:hypothetical protein [uncultured Alistipes sp.]
MLLTTVFIGAVQFAVKPRGLYGCVFVKILQGYIFNAEYVAGGFPEVVADNKKHRPNISGRCPEGCGVASTSQHRAIQLQPGSAKIQKIPPRKFQTKRIIKKSFCVIFITQKVFRVEWKADRDAGNQEIHALFLSPSAACVRRAISDRCD